MVGLVTGFCLLLVHFEMELRRKAVDLDSAKVEKVKSDFLPEYQAWQSALEHAQKRGGHGLTDEELLTCYANRLRENGLHNRDESKRLAVMRLVPPA